jgi:Icc-related predicted phosphoesterase
MIIFAFTDLHGETRLISKIEKKAKKADLVVCTGDLTVFENHLKKIVLWLHKLGKTTLVLHGNHESEHNLRHECSKYKNLIFLHKAFFEKNGVLFAGYGGGGFSLRDPAFEKFSGKIKAKAKGKKLILLLHGPPYGNKTDLIMDEHAGNKSYTKFIRKEKPAIVICGHLHENNGVSDMIGKTPVINPGPEGRLFSI